MMECCCYVLSVVGGVVGLFVFGFGCDVWIVGVGFVVLCVGLLLLYFVNM